MCVTSQKTQLVGTPHIGYDYLTQFDTKHTPVVSTKVDGATSILTGNKTFVSAHS